jgi:hypothetical protein
MAQIDCDEDGLKYFDAEEYKFVPLGDFTFSTYIALAIISRDAEPLADYLNDHPAPGRVLVRAPRTHDGILLRSGRLRAKELAEIVKFAKKHNIKVRTNGGDPYELRDGPTILDSAVGGISA